MYAPQKRYQSLSLTSRIEAAGPHELVTILYEELIRALDVCRAAVTHAKPDALRASSDRASSILVALAGSLDDERGGALAAQLSTIYASMQQELRMALQAGEPQRLEAIRRGVGDLLGAWSQISLRQAA